MPIKVLLVDDQPMARQALRGVLEGSRHLEVLAEAASAEEALKLVERLEPDVVVMDIVLPRIGGIEATRRIKTSHPTTRIVGVSFYTYASLVGELEKAGMSAFVAKDESYELLNSTILHVCRETGHSPAPERARPDSSATSKPDLSS
jgi:DNA-binding NarL/FixJ family response regulator